MNQPIIPEGYMEIGVDEPILKGDGFTMANGIGGFHRWEYINSSVASANKALGYTWKDYRRDPKKPYAMVIRKLPEHITLQVADFDQAIVK